MAVNLDPPTVAGFGAEWSRFDQSTLGAEELRELFDRYFRLFPWHVLRQDAAGADMGCGSGRWAACVAPRVGRLTCVDASPDALGVARRNLRHQQNCDFMHASLDHMSIPDGTLDFAYSLGVLHHMPDTAAGMRACVRTLKPGAPFMVYLYYAFDNRPLWYRALWRASDAARRGISRAPSGLRERVTDVVAASVYWPLARAAALLRRAGIRTEDWPLSYYADASFYTMRTDALDRLGTRVEHRFTRAEIQTMMEDAGLERIEFSPDMPYWCAVGFRCA